MNIAGLTVVTISGVMLAFDPVYGPGNRFRLKTAHNQLNNLISVRDSIISDWHAHPKWNDDRPRVEQQIKEVEDEYRPKDAALREKIDDLGDKFRGPHRHPRRLRRHTPHHRLPLTTRRNPLDGPNHYGLGGSRDRSQLPRR